MTYLEFLDWLEAHPLEGGDGSDKIHLLALVGVAWFEEALKKNPHLTLTHVYQAMFEGKYSMGGH
jgi:hypothetical protein